MDFGGLLLLYQHFINILRHCLVKDCNFRQWLDAQQTQWSLTAWDIKCNWKQADISHILLLGKKNSVFLHNNL